jgi:hypothetical protein
VLRAQRRRLVHAAMDAYLGWRDECEAVRDAYGQWASAGESDAAFAFAVFTAALDREQHASEVYAGLIGRVGNSVAPGRRASNGSRPLAGRTPMSASGRKAIEH